MPGYFISDLGMFVLCVLMDGNNSTLYFYLFLGDLYRTILPPGGEEEEDLTKVYVRMDYFTSVTKGYLSSMLSVLTNDELAYIVYAGEFILYMQAIRYITDYLNGDVYYKVKHLEHNFQRAQNQCVLLQHYRLLKEEMNAIVLTLIETKCNRV